MKQLIQFPANAMVDKVIPKIKIYQHASASNRLKSIFVTEVDKITWSYKLAPETINVPATKKVQEIQVVVVSLKHEELSRSVLEAIDGSIPSPLVFEIHHNDKVRYSAAYKRPSEADKSKWVVGEYFDSEWVKSVAEKRMLPVALNMEILYQEILQLLLPVQLRQGETIEAQVARAELLGSKKREADKMIQRIGREKQFNRKVEINRELNMLLTEIESIQL